MKAHTFNTKNTETRPCQRVSRFHWVTRQTDSANCPGTFLCRISPLMSYFYIIGYYVHVILAIF